MRSVMTYMSSPEFRAKHPTRFHLQSSHDTTSTPAARRVAGGQGGKRPTPGGVVASAQQAPAEVGRQDWTGGIGRRWVHGRLELLNCFKDDSTPTTALL